MNIGPALGYATKEPPEETYLRIGEVTEVTRLTQRTIRYYEEIGLLPPPTRTQGAYRLFSEGDIRRLGEIVGLKDLLGFSLAEIKEMVEGEEVRSQLHSEYHAADNIATRLSKLDEATRLTERQLQLLDRKMTQMVELKGDMKVRLERYAQKKIELESKLAGEKDK
jgi:MerR family transcriptional regulator, repressor of the yfmOP operon